MEDLERARNKNKTAGRRHKGDGGKADAPAAAAKKILTVEDGTETPLTGVAIYLLRTSTKRTLGQVIQKKQQSFDEFLSNNSYS